MSMRKFPLTSCPITDYLGGYRSINLTYTSQRILTGHCFDLEAGKRVSCVVTKHSSFKRNLLKIGRNGLYVKL